MNELKESVFGLFSLAIFRDLLNDEVLSSFVKIFDGAKSEKDAINDYSDFVAKLYKHTDNFSDYLLGIVFEAENPYILKIGYEELSDNYKNALENELNILNKISKISSDDIKKFLRITVSIPQWRNSDIDIFELYNKRIETISLTGYGIFAKYHMFSIKDGKIVPVKYPDPQKLSEFCGYELEREKVILNTKALLSKSPCNNVLLYGDAGSGKSSTVKAIANEFKDEGLRLIEVKKNQLYSLPDIMDTLSKNPLKFIIFIDDLSFSRNDEDFGALKAILEGSASGRSNNIAIYATSNRRHLVKESFSDREGDDLHIQDTIQELTSLSARFGLKVTFSKPDKSLFGTIVCDLAKQNGIDIPEDELIMKAEAHALRNGGRSPRSAKQFIDYLAYTSEQ
ncbi:MAG: ATP-binding protein [Oscillospiraceae bacterium]